MYKIKNIKNELITFLAHVHVYTIKNTKCIYIHNRIQCVIPGRHQVDAP